MATLSQHVGTTREMAETVRGYTRTYLLNVLHHLARRPPLPPDLTREAYGKQRGFQPDMYFDARKHIYVPVGWDGLEAALSPFYKHDQVRALIAVHQRLLKGSSSYTPHHTIAVAARALRDISLGTFERSPLLANGYELSKFTLRHPEAEIIREGDVVACIPSVIRNSKGLSRQAMLEELALFHERWELPKNYFHFGTMTELLLAMHVANRHDFHQPSDWVTTNTQLTSYLWKRRFGRIRFLQDRKIWAGWSFRTTADSRHDAAGFCLVLRIPGRNSLKN